MLAIVLTGCRDEMESVQADHYMQIFLPVNEARSLPRRAAGAGDPGQAENLELPHYAYIFLVYKMKNDNEMVRTTLATDLYNGGSRTTDDVWEWVDTLTTGGDIVYSCKIPFTDMTPVLGNVKYCHAYIAMSHVPLTLKMGATTIDNAHKPTNEATVQNITFTVNDALQPELQNIYSTPYNYMVDDLYYGNLYIWQDAVRAKLMLYHVASKVDFMWNVPEQMQPKMRITRVAAKNLFEGESYLFKPVDNVHAVFNGSGDPDGYTPATDLAGNSAGTWWAGRSYFYTIPYTTTGEGKFPLQVDFEIENTDSEDATHNGNTYTYQETFSTTPTDTVFPLWLRGQLTFSTPPTTGKTETKEVQ